MTEPNLMRDRVLGMSRTRLAELLASRAVWGAVCGVAILAVYGAYTWLIPAAAAQVAGTVPTAWEARLGSAVSGHLIGSSRVSRNNSANDAVERITDALLRAYPDNPYSVSVTVVDAPGGNIVVYTGLMRRMDAPEQLAGVPAHELQHVFRRHTTRALFQQSAVAVLASLLTGDTGGSMDAVMSGVSTMGALAYSRRYEREADAGAVEMLRRAKVDVGGLVDFFQGIEERESGPAGSLSYFSTHPATSRRIAAIKAMAREEDYQPQPLMTDEEWAAAVRR